MRTKNTTISRGKRLVRTKSKQNKYLAYVTLRFPAYGTGLKLWWRSELLYRKCSSDYLKYSKYLFKRIYLEVIAYLQVTFGLIENKKLLSLLYWHSMTNVQRDEMSREFVLVETSYASLCSTKVKYFYFYKPTVRARKRRFLSTGAKLMLFASLIKTTWTDV